jgi:glycosyltransferase involved in cell wall biosynthesis
VLYCDPTDAVSIAEGLRRLATEPALRAHLSHAGHARARTFTWRRTAEATLATYEGVAGE